MDSAVVDLPAPPMESASIGSLPLELHQQVLSYLPWRDHLNCEHVCKSWRETIRLRCAHQKWTTAPWMLNQTYDLGFYDILKIHNIVIDKKSFVFKARDGFRLALDTVFAPGEEESGVMEETIEATQAITELNWVERDENGERELPMKNMGMLDDWFVLPAFVEEDEITKLYVSWERKVPREDDDTAEEDNNDDNDGNNDGDGNDTGNGNDGNDGNDGDDDDDDDDGNAINNGPPMMTASYGSFTLDVYKRNPTTQTEFRLSIGHLLTRMRSSLLNDVFNAKGITEDHVFPEDADIDEMERIAREREEQRRMYEEAPILVEELRTERCREEGALSIAFNGIFMLEKEATTTQEEVEVGVGTSAGAAVGMTA